MANNNDSGPISSAEATNVDTALAAMSRSTDLSQDVAPAAAPAGDISLAAMRGLTDLSQDVASTATPVDNIALEESLHRTGLQKSAFSSAICAAMLLYSAAAVFGGLLIYRYTVLQSPVDWHLSALAGAFIVPPTVIIIALIRAVYHKSDDKPSGESLPALNLLKELAVAVKEVVSAAK